MHETNTGPMRGCVLASWIALTSWTAHAGAQSPEPATEGARGDEAHGGHSKLAEQATDPTQSPQTLRFKTSVTTNSYELADGTQPDTGVKVELQPVLPFTAWGVDNIFRLTIPYQIAGSEPNGLGDVQAFDLIVLKLPVGRLGVGAVANLSAPEKDVPSHASGGPAIGFVGPVAPALNLGVFSQNLFADGIAVSVLQPIIALQLGRGWSLSTGDMQLVYDWEKTSWVRIPIQLEVGKVFSIAKQAMRLAAGCEYNFKDRPGADRFQLKFNVELLLQRTL